MSVLVMSQVFKHSSAKLGARLVLLALADSAHDDGVTWINQDTIAEKAKVGLKTVSRTVADLEESGELEVRKVRRGSSTVNVYRVLVPVLSDVEYDKLPFPVEPLFTRSDCPSDPDLTTSSTTVPPGHPVQKEGVVLLTGKRKLKRNTRSAPDLPAVGRGVVAVVGIEMPKKTKVDGRDLPFDALVKVCGYDPESPRIRGVGTALGNTEKIIGIRSLFWIECTRSVERDPILSLRLAAMAANPELFERALAARIEQKAEAIRWTEPWRTITPHVVRDLWLDVEQARTSGRPSSEEIEEAFGGR